MSDSGKVGIYQTVANAVTDAGQRALVHKMMGELLITVEDQFYKGAKFYIDGYRFINCSFEDCELWVLRGTFEFHHCLFKGGSNIFDEEALKCIQLFAHNDPQPVFHQKVYEDGSISIAKGVTFQ